MSELALWQKVVIIASAVVFIGGMTLVVWRLFARTSTGKAVARPGTAAESMLYDAKAPTGAEVFDGFSYRVSARFAGRARVIIDGDRVSFCGPRGPKGLYVFWIWLQGALLAAVPVALIWAAVALDWHRLLWALGLLVASVLVMAIGAGVWPGLGETPGLGDGHYPALEFSAGDVRDVKIGPGWADGGLWIVLLPYYKGIDAIAAGHAVSWWGPDESGNEVRYAFHCYDTDAARALYDQLKAAEK